MYLFLCGCGLKNFFHFKLLHTSLIFNRQNAVVTGIVRYYRSLRRNPDTVLGNERPNSAVHSNIAFQIDEFVMKTFTKFHLLDVTTFQVLVLLVYVSNLSDDLQ